MARSLPVAIIAMAVVLFANGCATRPAQNRDHDALVAAEIAVAMRL